MALQFFGPKGDLVPPEEKAAWAARRARLHEKTLDRLLGAAAAIPSDGVAIPAGVVKAGVWNGARDVQVDGRDLHPFSLANGLLFGLLGVGILGAIFHDGTKVGPWISVPLLFLAVLPGVFLSSVHFRGSRAGWVTVSCPVLPTRHMVFLDGAWTWRDGRLAPAWVSDAYDLVEHRSIQKQAKKATQVQSQREEIARQEKISERFPALEGALSVVPEDETGRISLSQEES